MKPYYDDGKGIVIYHGDCRELINEQTPDVLITDPPYGINVGDNQSAAEKRAGLLVKQSYLSYKDTKENYQQIIVPVIAQLISETIRACVFGFAPNIWLLPAPTAIGGIYCPAGCGRSKWGFNGFMPVLFYGIAPNLHLGAKPTCIYSTDTSEPCDHPTPKPQRWLNWLVELATTPDNIVIDPFMGSGTTLRACKDLGRKCIGIELEERYCEIGAKRLAQEVFDFTEPFAFCEKAVVAQ